MKKIAVIKTGGKQYLVAENQQLEIDKVPGNPKDKIKFSQVMLLVDKEQVKIGQPLLEKYSVDGEIVNQVKDKKIRVAKFRAKSRYRKVQGHRQLKTVVKIGKINLGASSAHKK